MLKIKIFAILITVIQLVHSDVEADYCYSKDEDPYLLAGTKTAYQIMHGSIKNTTLPNCKPTQIWMLMRHGTRNAKKKEIKAMIKALPELQKSIIQNHEERGNGKLCQDDLEKLKAWTIGPNLDKHKSKYLTKQGEVDLLLLAERFKSYFPDLLKSSSNENLNGTYKFRSTNTERTIASMNYFITGLFNTTAIEREIVSTSNDTLLKLYKTCKPWLEEMNNASANAEDNKLIAGSLYTETIDRVSQRLGFTQSLPSDVVMSMYTACAFENAWYPEKHSPWCAAFAKDELKLFEYEEDLYYYYHASYGGEMSEKVGCPPLKDMFTHFSKLENGDESEEPRGIFYFTHSSSLQLLLTSMELAKDTTPLTASNFKEMSARKWRTSYLAPFAGNLAAIFHKCDSSNKVQLFLNEKPLEYEGCEMGVCDWEYLKKKIGSNAFNCDISFCKK